MSSGVYRPRLHDDGLAMLPDEDDYCNPLPCKDVKKHRTVPPRIESLPNIQGGPSTPGAATSKRKAYSTKSYRKHIAKNRNAVNEATAEESTTSSCSSTGDVGQVTYDAIRVPVQVGRLQTPSSSPINSSGVRIVIDMGSDTEPDTVAMDESVVEVGHGVQNDSVSGLGRDDLDCTSTRDGAGLQSNSQMFLLGDMM